MLQKQKKLQIKKIRTTKNSCINYNPFSYHLLMMWGDFFMTSSTAKRKTKASINENSEAKQYAIAILKGFAFGTASLFILFSICSFKMVRLDYTEKSVPIMALVSAMLAAFLGGYGAARCIRKKGLMIGVFTSIPLVIVITSFVAIANGGTISSLTVTAILLMIIMSGFGGVVSVNKKIKK